MLGTTTRLRKGMVLEPRDAPVNLQRLCVLLDEASQPQVRLRVVRRDSAGLIVMTPQEFTVPLAALEILQPVEGLHLEL